MAKPPPFPSPEASPGPRLTPVATVSARPGADPVQTSFDRMVALGGYVLLFVSPFTLGAPALAAVALAVFHRQDAQPLIRSHYRFQIRIFFAALVLAALGVLALLVGGGLLLDQLVRLIEVYAQQLADLIGGSNRTRQALMGGGLVFAGLGFFALGLVWTLAASAFGFLRLLANRPIGHGET